MCCNSGRHHREERWGHQHACGCGCRGGEYSRPRFITKAKRIAHLEAHLADLQEEVKAVKEHIAEIKKQK
jgi:hypothetical protein